MILFIPSIFETASLLHSLIQDFFGESMVDSTVLSVPGQDAFDEEFGISEFYQKVLETTSNKEHDQRILAGKMIQKQKLVQAKLLKDKKIHLITTGYGSILGMYLLGTNMDIFDSLAMLNFQPDLGSSFGDRLRLSLGMLTSLESEFQGLVDSEASLLSKKAFRTTSIRQKTKYTLIQEYPQRLGMKSYIKLLKNFDFAFWLKNLTAEQKQALMEMPILATTDKNSLSKALEQSFKGLFAFKPFKSDYFTSPGDQSGALLDFYTSIYPVPQNQGKVIVF